MNRLISAVGAFIAAGVILSVALIGTFSGGQPQGPTYYALFRDASGLKSGSDVRVAGVTVGRVAGVDVLRDNTARIQFSAQTDFTIERTSEATIKYKNVIGDRYLAITEGRGPAPALRPGEAIPASQTHPALSLDDLFNGFSPLFQGLQPAEVNQLSTSIISIFQGEGGSIDGLLGQIGSLTGTLADRDKVIGDLITNLDAVLATVDSHSSQLSSTVSKLSTLVTGLSADRGRIGHSISGINDATSSISGLLHDGRPDIRDAIHELGRFSDSVDRDSPQLDSILQKLPGYYQVLGRIGGHSAAVQFYLCGLQARVSIAGQTVTSPMIQSEVPRCQF
jgi:phospholipid/cholesterol/gamma-HCH transport system substrate-binding protein